MDDISELLMVQGVTARHLLGLRRRTCSDLHQMNRGARQSDLRR